MDQSPLNTPYQPFDTFVFRTPHIPFGEFIRNLERLDAGESYWPEFLQDKRLQEAIFLGTPVLYDEIQKFLNGTLTAAKDVSRLKMSVMRYYTRMSTRCTPFGLFAGFSLGKAGTQTDIRLVDPASYSRYTRLDMNYLCNLAQDIGKQETIRKHLRYYPNTSIYSLGERLRYVEYYYQNAKRVHRITAVDRTSYLELVLQKAEKGATVEALAALLLEPDVSPEEATGFIDELIDSQLLVSDLEPAITGKDFLIQLSAVLQAIPEHEELKENVSRLTGLLSGLDKAEIGTTLPVYAEIEEIIKEIKTAYEAKFLFQTDMYKPADKAVLDETLLQSVFEALELQNRLTLPQTETTLSKFAENYYERYEDREMPLLRVLDTETGIGYPQSSGDFSPLLDGYVLPANQPGQTDIKWNRIQSVLHKKFLEAYKNQAYTVEIEEKDFDFLKANWDDLPLSLSCMCEIFSPAENGPLVYVHGNGGSSAANLLGRFCHVDQELEDYTREITAYEQAQNPEAIYAEIVHLPESRIGNILLRPVLRPHEIPYLGKPAVESEYQISLSDLWISVSGRKITLRSRRLGKQIIPRMSTAHNYSFHSMPVYHFLCDMQTQGLRGGMGFYWGGLAGEYEFLPRVKYKNAVLSLAKWTVKTEDFKKLLGWESKTKEDKAAANQEISETAKQPLKLWREEKQIPRYVVLPDGDNELFVDLENVLSLQTLYSTIKKRPAFQLEEFPFDTENAVVKDENGNCFTNEFVFGFYKTQKS